MLWNEKKNLTPCTSNVFAFTLEANFKLLAKRLPVEKYQKERRKEGKIRVAEAASNDAN